MQVLPGEYRTPSHAVLNKNFNDINVPAAEVAAFLTPTEYALIGELLARGGADYTSNWTYGRGKMTKLGPTPPGATTYFKINPNQRPHNNPNVELLLNNRRCITVVGFNDLDRATAIWEAATDGLRALMKQNRRFPRALHPKRPAGT